MQDILLGGKEELTETPVSVVHQGRPGQMHRILFRNGLVRKCRRQGGIFRTQLSVGNTMMVDCNSDERANERAIKILCELLLADSVERCDYGYYLTIVNQGTEQYGRSCQGIGCKTVRLAVKLVGNIVGTAFLFHGQIRSNNTAE